MSLNGIGIPDDVQHQIRILGTHNDPDSRKQAALKLARCNISDAISALVHAMNDRNMDVRDAACRSLLEIGGENVAQAIVPCLRAGDSSMRDLAAEVLCRNGPASIRAVELCLYDHDETVRSMAEKILGLLKRDETMTSYVSLLHDSDPNVVISAIDSLGNLGNEDAVQHLIQIFDREKYTRAAVTEALGKIKGDRAMRFLADRFGKFIGDSDSDSLVLFRIIEAIASIGNAEAFSLLSSHFPRVQGKLRRMMLGAMVWIADQSGLSLDIPGATTEDLTTLLEDPDLRVRLNAVKAMAGCSDREVTVALLNVLGKSEYVDVVLFGVLASREDAFLNAVEKLEDPATTNKTELIVLLGAIGQRGSSWTSESRVPALSDDVVLRAFAVTRNQWQSADEKTRRSIVNTLFTLNNTRTVRMLETLMEDPDPWARMRVIELLSTLDNEQIPEFIGRISTDEDDMVRSTVEWVLEGKGCSHQVKD